MSKEFGLPRRNLSEGRHNPKRQYVEPSTEGANVLNFLTEGSVPEAVYVERTIVRKVDLRSEPDLRTEEIARRKQDLVTHGFSEAWVERVKETRPTLFSIATVIEHLDGLSEQGFTQPQKMVQTNPLILGYSLESIDEKVSGFQQRGFSDPQRLIQTQPSLLGFSLDSIDQKVAGLEERGFPNPQKMIESKPAILGYTLESIDAKLAGLEERGINLSKKAIQGYPQILGLSLETIDEKLTRLQELGFNDPQQMIQAHPQMIGYSMTSVEEKIRGLQERGFTNPNQMAQVLSLSLKNIDSKLGALSSLKKLYNLPFDPPQLMEQQPTLFQAKMEKIFVLARIAREYKVTPEEVNSTLINRLNTSNLEDNLIAFTQRTEDEPISQLIFRAKEVKSRGLSKAEKREIIARDLTDEKMKRTYFRGYPQAV